jgi:pimeloyl-ACP methyl ester carboxylesterase
MNWTFHTLESNGQRIHYRRNQSGAGKQVFILAHGFSDDSGCWPLVAAALNERYDLIALDARGHGKSSDPSEGYSTADHAADYAGLITGLGLQKPIMLGHSMGAINTLAVAALYPQLLGKILLEDPPPAWHFPYTPHTQDRDAVRRSAMRDWIMGLKRKLHAEIVSEVKGNHPKWDEVEFEPWADSKQRVSLNVLNGGGVGLDWAVILSNVTCPALLITSDPALGGLVTDEHVASLKRYLPNLKVQHIANAGHSIHREQFSAYMTTVNAFVDENA